MGIQQMLLAAGGTGGNGPSSTAGAAGGAGKIIFSYT